jgi:glycosyltransferase involved in cell wall biosynthesis
VPLVSVVFATHNRAARLRTLLRSLREQTVGVDSFEVIVVDDGSSDETASVLVAESEAGVLDLRTVRHERARGPAAARNAGWALARAPLVAFTDDDCRADPAWLQAGLGAWEGRIDRFMQGRTDPDPLEQRELGPFSRTMRVDTLGPWYQTCNMFYPRALLERMEGFDQAGYPGMAAEDSDLAWRCIEAGCEGVFAADAVVLHAVHNLGPVGKLRVAWRWHGLMLLFATHPGARTTLKHGIFWKQSHYLLARAALAAVLPRRMKLLRAWCLAPLAPAYLARARDEGAGVWAAPYLVLHDAVEVAAAVRGAVRYRTPVL